MAPYRFLSGELGKPVRCRDGAVVGRIVDVTVRLGGSHPRVHRVAIGRGRRITHLVPWSVVGSVGGDGVRLTADAASLQTYAAGPAPALEPSELLLARDVVDTQVVDLAGQRLSRVSDAVIAPAATGEDAQGSAGLVVVSVDVGVGSLLRRMGLGWLGRRLRPVIVDWGELHLVSERGNTAQLRATTTIHRRTPRELAVLLSRLTTRQAVRVLRTIGPHRSATALQASHPVPRGRLLRALGPDEAQRLIEAASPEAAATLARAHEQAAARRRRRWRRTAGWRVHRAPEQPHPSHGRHPPQGARP